MGGGRVMWTRRGDRRRDGMRVAKCGCGGARDSAVDDELCSVLRRIHAGGGCGRRPLHMSF